VQFQSTTTPDLAGAAPKRAAAAGGRALAWLRLLRPAQWSKNVFLFAGLIFGHKLLDGPSVLRAALGFACFCVLSSAVYVFNDIQDRNEDRLHPSKRFRPIASGEIGVAAALLLALGMLTASLVASWLLSPGLLVLAIVYLVLQAGYTLALKHVVLLDIVCIGLGFVLRAMAGAVVVHVAISHWLVICTFTLCLFMGFSKRRCELSALAENGTGSPGDHRRTLSLYTPDLLNHFTTLTAGIAVVTFLLYATDGRTVREFHTNYLVYTLPLVVYAIFRFAYLVEHGRVDGPTDVLLRDRPFQAAIVVWTLAAVAIVYRGLELKEALGRIIGQT
jgi:4-hydroxybenzoate polyprenyltransferase